MNTPSRIDGHRSPRRRIQTAAAVFIMVAVIAAAAAIWSSEQARESRLVVSIEALSAADAESRLQAIKSIGDAGKGLLGVEPGAVTALFRILDREDDSDLISAGVRSLNALGGINMPEILAAYGKLFKEGDSERRNIAAWQLYSVDEKALVYMIDHFGELDSEVRWDSLFALSISLSEKSLDQRDPRLEKLYVVALGDPKPRVRGAAAIGLNIFGTAAGYTALRDRLHVEDDGVARSTMMRILRDWPSGDRERARLKPATKS